MHINIGANFCVLAILIVGILVNNRNLIIMLVTIELMLLCINLNFLYISNMFEDVHGQIFSISVLAVAASESAIGIGLIILFFKSSNHVMLDAKVSLRH